MDTIHTDFAIDTIYPSAGAFEQARSTKKLRIYFGIDPTADQIHLGHACALRVLRQFQEQGHHIVLLFGDFTARIGDPSERDKTRPVLAESEIQANVNHYLEQVKLVLDVTKTEIRLSSEWYADPKRSGLLAWLFEIGREFTAAQLWERDMFQERQAKGAPVTISEFLYPVLQAYDSVELKADAELGGTDQTFNMLAGRDLVKRLQHREKFVITTKLLTGTDGRKMSKSYGNAIGLTDSPTEMYGRLMSVRDELMPEYFALALGVDPADSELSGLITNSPRAAKAKLALEVVTLYHGVEAGQAAAEAFDRQYRDHELPNELPTRTPTITNQERLTFYLVDLGLAASKTEAARLITQQAVKVDGEPITDQFAVITPYDGMVIQVGKRHIIRLELK